MNHHHHDDRSPSQSSSRVYDQDFDHDHDHDHDIDISIDPDESANMSGQSRREAPKKRNRAALSCVACRERKIKCNRQVPCDQCTKRGDQELCFLDPHKRGPPAAQSKSTKVQALLQAQAEQQAERERQRQLQHLPPPPSHEQQMQQLHQHHPVHHPQHQRRQHSQSSQQQHQQPRQPYSAQQGQSQRNSMFHPSMWSAPDSSIAATARQAGGHSEAEFEAIKNRLAQLEAAFANGRSAPPMANPFSPSGYSDPSPSSSHSYQQSLPSLSGHTPSRMWEMAGSHQDAPRLPPLRSSAGANQFAPEMSQQRSASGTFTSVPQNDTYSTAPSSVRSPQSHLASLAGKGEEEPKLGPDSDTEDAAMVLEGLAMSAPDNDHKRKGASSGARPGDASAVVKEPKETLLAYSARNKERDIMLDVAEGGTSSKGAGDMVICPISCKAIDPRQAGMRSLEEVQNLERAGFDFSPADAVCTRLRDSKSLFRPIWGPESMLGFGMGWAFPAAEVAQDLHVKGGECPGSAQREAVLRAIIRSLPRREIAMQLFSVFADRVSFMTGNIIHIPSFRRELEAFYSFDSVESKARVINNVDVGWLAAFQMVLLLALRFYPCRPPGDWIPIKHLFDGRTVHMWASSARTALVLARYTTSQSLAVLQAILLNEFAEACTGKCPSLQQIRIAITNAQLMGLHRLGDKDKRPRPEESPSVTIRREVAKRIWYHLVLKDWACSMHFGGIRMINNKDFNTPPPGNYNDEDLEQKPVPPARLRSEHTEMSFSLQSIEFAKVVKLHSDTLHDRRLALEEEGKEPPWDNPKLTCTDGAKLDAAYRELLENLPSFFAVGSTEGEGTNIEIQRWIFQQAVFHRLLKLHRPKLSSNANARTCCVALARSLLETQKKLRSRCTVIDRLLSTLSQSYEAAMVLLLDLLQHGSCSTDSMRSLIRSEVAEALCALHHVNETMGGYSVQIRVIEALLAEEQTQWDAEKEEAAANGSAGLKRKRSNGGMGSTRQRKSMLQMARRIAEAIKADSGDPPSQSSNKSVAPTAPEVAQEGSDMDVARVNQEHEKDALSRAFLQQLLVPQWALGPNGSDMPMNQDSRGAPGAGYGFDLSSVQGLAAPSVLDAFGSATGGSGTDNNVDSFWGRMTPPEDSAFDLSGFLAQYNSGKGNTGAGSVNGGDDGASITGSSNNGGASTGGGSSNTGYETSISSQHGLSGNDWQRFQDSPQSLTAFGSSALTPPNNGKSNSPTVQRQTEGPEGSMRPSLQHDPSLSSLSSVSSGEQQRHGIRGSYDSTPSNPAGLDAFYNWILSQAVSVSQKNNGSQHQHQQPQPQPQQVQQSSSDMAQPNHSGAQKSSSSYFDAPIPGSAPSLMSPNGNRLQNPMSTALPSNISWNVPLGGFPHGSWSSGNDLGSNFGAVQTSAPPQSGHSQGEAMTSSASQSASTPIMGSTAFNLGTPSAGLANVNTATGGVFAGTGANTVSTPSTTASAAWGGIPWLSGPGLLDFEKAMKTMSGGATPSS